MTTPGIPRAAEVIASASNLVIVGHINPDGDALGSAIGLALAARASGRNAVVSFGGRVAVDGTYGFLDLEPMVPAAEVPEDPEVLVIVDVAARDRLGELAPLIDRAGTVVVVDHHVTNDGFGDVEVIDPAAGATAQLVYHLIRELGWPIGVPCGTALLAGIVTDTGRFQYSSTDPDILRVAADLVELGVEPDLIGRHVYESTPYGYLQVSSAVLGRSHLEPELGLVWTAAYDADLDAAAVGWEDCDQLIDDLRIAREADVAVLLKEIDGGFKVSLRSRGRVDVGSIAVALGGGGHHNAAGFTSEVGEDATMEEIRSRLS